LQLLIAEMLYDYPHSERSFHGGGFALKYSVFLCVMLLAFSLRALPHNNGQQRLPHEGKGSGPSRRPMFTAKDFFPEAAF